MLGFYSNNTKKQLYGGHYGTGATSGNTLGHKKIKDYSYNPSDRIGKGFSSIVYKGLNQNSNEIVAIKAIDMKGVKDSISRQMLQCEIEALKTIKHENVLKCFDVVRESSHCYIVTEFCNQGDLSGLVKKKRRLTEEETMKILKDIVSGFVEIGQKGFLHRDLKLANIFINDDRAKIADFGFAKKNKFSSQKQKYNVGSPLYMSPQALKRNIYSLKNDIWSIGIMTYQMLHGQTPWQCKTQKQLIDKMTRIPVRFRDSLRISEPLKQFIKKCLEVDERERMSLEDLRAWLNGESCKQLNSYSDNVLGPTRTQNLPKLNISHKPLSNAQKHPNQPQLTQRLSSRSHRQLNPHSTTTTHTLNLNTHSNKQNISGRPSALGVIPKSTIEKNNGVVVNEINTFRLIYKMMEKIRKCWVGESEVVRVLGGEVVRRVSVLRDCFEGVGGGQYGLGMLECYLSEKSNPGIKKYKSVVQQYYKKYTTEIKPEQPHNPTHPVQTELKRLLQRKAPTLKQQQDLLICFWIVQFLGVSRQTSKEKLDSIIDPKSKLNRLYIEQRIREVV